MEKRKCLHCDNPLPENKRADSKFCSNSCKAWYWDKHKNSKESSKPILEIKQETKIENGTPLEGLRGVIDNTAKAEIKPPILSSANYPLKPVSDCLPTAINVENSEYKKLQNKKDELFSEFKREGNILSDLESEIKITESSQNDVKGIQEIKDFKPNSDMYLLREFYENDIDSDWKFESKKQYKLKELKAHQTDYQRIHEQTRVGLLKTLEILAGTPQFQPQLITMEKTSINKPPSEPEENETTLGETQGKIETNNRIISSRELMKLDYKSLNFQHRWKDFLGQPAVIFHFAIHGLPGGGKSTFCLQLADYLADSFGNVIYVSGEEGYSKTLKDKVILTKADSHNLYFHDAKNMEDIRENIPADQYHFIFIDSLDTLRIDAIKLRELRKYYPNSAFVTISQSRKDGKMKGDSEILHDADTIIKVHDGIATLSKNRFNSIADKYFEVFPKGNENKKVKGFSELKNVI